MHTAPDQAKASWLFANLRESNSITSSGEFVGSTDALPFQSRSRNVAKSHHPLARCTKATCGGSSTSTWSISTGHDHTRASTSTFRNRGIQQPPRFVLGLMSSPSQFWAVFTTSIARSFDAVRVGRKAADGVRRHDTSPSWKISVVSSPPSVRKTSPESCGNRLRYVCTGNLYCVLVDWSTACRPPHTPSSARGGRHTVATARLPVCERGRRTCLALALVVHPAITTHFFGPPMCAFAALQTPIEPL